MENIIDVKFKEFVNTLIVKEKRQIVEYLGVKLDADRQELLQLDVETSETADVFYSISNKDGEILADILTEDDLWEKLRELWNMKNGRNVKCLNCNSYYTETELVKIVERVADGHKDYTLYTGQVTKEDTDEIINGCPCCLTDSYLMDLE